MAIAVTATVISPWSFWVLFALCLLQLVSAKVATDVLYISNDIQLLLLPLLGISGTVSAAAAGRQARRDFGGLRSALTEMSGRIERIENMLAGANAIRETAPEGGAGEEYPPITRVS